MIKAPTNGLIEMTKATAKPRITLNTTPSNFSPYEASVSKSGANGRIKVYFAISILIFFNYL